MARRKRPARNTRPAARWIDWSEAFATAFRLASSDWTPPAQVRLSGGLYRQTLSARFRTADGTVMTAKIHLTRDPVSGERYVRSEELCLSLGIASPRAEG